MQPNPFFSSTPQGRQPGTPQQAGGMPAGFIPQMPMRGAMTPTRMVQPIRQGPPGVVQRMGVPNMVAPHPALQQQMYSQGQPRPQFVTPGGNMMTPQRMGGVLVPAEAQSTPRRPGPGAIMHTPTNDAGVALTPMTDMKRRNSIAGAQAAQPVVPQSEPRRPQVMQHGKTSPPPPTSQHSGAAAGQVLRKASSGDAYKSSKGSGDAAKATNPEDEIGHYKVVTGSKIDFTRPFTQGRYTVVKLLGSGTYGKVVKCEDHKYNRAGVAVKLVRREPPLYRVSAKNEIAILRELDGRSQTLKLLRDFEHQGHICMTFELLGDDLSEVLRRNARPFRMEHVRDISFQLLQAVAYVHSKNIIHTDLKAENILLVNNPSGACSIKVVDFGSALFSSAWHPPLVGTMHYRAPEAVLQAGWSFPLDVWAIACLVVELVTGKHLFELAHDDVHLHMMERALGPIPADLLRKGYANLNQYNTALLQRDARGAVRIAPCRPDGFQMVQNMRRLKDLVQDPTLLDLLRQMLEYDPARRISAQKALLHPFFNLADDDIDSIASPTISYTNEEAGAGEHGGDRRAGDAATAVSEAEGRKVLDFLVDASEMQNPPPGGAPADAPADASEPTTPAKRHSGDARAYPIQPPRMTATAESPGKENKHADVRGYPLTLMKTNGGKELPAGDEDETTLLSSAPTPHEGEGDGAPATPGKLNKEKLVPWLGTA